MRTYITCPNCLQLLPRFKKLRSPRRVPIHCRWDSTVWCSGSQQVCVEDGGVEKKTVRKPYTFKTARAWPKESLETRFNRCINLMLKFNIVGDDDMFRMKREIRKRIQK